MMFACAYYPTNDRFLQSVEIEITQQVGLPCQLLNNDNNEYLYSQNYRQAECTFYQNCAISYSRTSYTCKKFINFVR